MSGRRDPAPAEQGAAVRSQSGETPRLGAPAAAIAAAILAVAAALGPGLWTSERMATACATYDRQAATTPIQHVFFLIKENHAFENYFGSLPGVLGNPPNASLPTTWGGSTYVHPFALNRTATGDLPHDPASAIADFDNGRNDGFVAEATLAGAAAPADAAGYYTSAQIGPYFAYAQSYALADRFFTGVAGPTEPNRLFDLAATNVTESGDFLPPPGGFDVPTVLDQLEAAGLPWAYDYTNYTPYLAPLYFAPLTSEPCTSRSFVPLDELGSQLARPEPPAVVYIDPSGDHVHSEHPPENVSLGTQWTVSVVNSILSSPIGPSSVIFLFFDEFGGFWDPIPPPVVGGLPEGFRVPLTVISDYTPAGIRIHQTLDPASLLRFVDDNFHLPYLNARVASASPLTGVFDFTHPPRSPVLLPTNVSFVSGALGAGRVPAAIPTSHDGAGFTGAIPRPGRGPSYVGTPRDLGRLYLRDSVPQGGICRTRYG